MRDVRVFPDLPTLAEAACMDVMLAIRTSVAERGRAVIALSGGATPRTLYQKLATHPELPWDRVELCFGDERAVPSDHPESNARMVDEVLTQREFVPSARVHRIRAELPPSEAARHYEDTLRALFPMEDFPRFDLVLLGLGADGHTASLFRNSKALEERRRWVVENWVQPLGATRITLTYPALNAAHACLFLVSGKDKACALGSVLAEHGSAREVPARGIQPESGKLAFLVDQAAMSSGSAPPGLRSGELAPE